ncbi:Transcription repressor ofp17 [Thalictrum thalictroides]|uniref:Transcription repressor ofp17 n=1 Tax=Thalictrum thalictroides TaxID=46969 RepID=A0A7J6V138_THATH|nr:Transcription repressor ofp17 [Thalictrum thalictroides]
MKVKSLVAFKSKLLKPCRKFLQIFRFKRHISIRTLNCFRRQHKTSKPKRKKGFRAVFSCFRSKKREHAELEDIVELRSMGEGRTDSLLYPSPLTPAYLKSCKVVRKELVKGQDEVEDACRSFENYLLEMIMEEGKLRDLSDVEELLYCWKNLQCPVFKSLVCRFYGELCKDLFSGQDD